MVLEIKPLVNPIVKDFINNYSKLVSNTTLLVDEGVKHIIFPQVMEENINKIKEELTDGNAELYLAMKSTHSLGLIEEAKKQEVGIEVSSLGELEVALEKGFKKIIAGGPKNNSYLKKSIGANTLISVDSIDELRKIVRTGNKARIMLRISNPESIGKNVLIKTSRFGIRKKEIEDALNIITENKERIILEGFHFHADGYDAETKKGFIMYFFNLISECNKKGLNQIKYINIGGGFRHSLIEDQNTWLKYIRQLENDLTEGNDIKVWGNYTYGMSINEKGKVSGRTIAESKGVKNDYISEIKTILYSKIQGSNFTISDLLFENDFTLILEPGFALSTTAGITIIDVIGTKTTPCKAELILLDGHMFSLSVNMIEHLTDPHLISMNDSKEEYEAYLIGSLCREDDFLMKRKVKFPNKPEEGDKLIFLNTGSYAMSYEQCTPQRHQKPKYIRATKNNDTWEINNDN